MSGESKTKKRLIVCCDGTWKDQDGVPDQPSNVTRIARCLKNEATIDGRKIPQIIFYQSGVGTDRGMVNKVVGGVSGKGISDNIREAYSFICANYTHGDEIFLVGFSRGAYTVRSISTLMQSVGVLTRKGIVYLYSICKDWENQDQSDWKSPFQSWPGKPNDNVKSDEYRQQLVRQELTRLNVPVKACAVFDTVGSLGIPSLGLLPKLTKQHLAFVDTKVEQNIEHAFQALALDELRRPFSPTIWEVPDGQENPKVLKQCWFPGVHSDVGGGYPDSELANITLAWMVSNLEPFLEFDKSYILEQQDQTNAFLKAKRGELSAWGLGRLHDSFKPEYWLAGKQVRTPANYYELEPQPFLPSLMGMSKYRNTPRHLKNTRQTLHSSVRVRISLNKEGLGYNGEGKYDCAALEGWSFEHQVPLQSPDQNAEGLPLSKYIWRKETGEKDEPFLEMEEDTMGELENLLLKHWSPQVWDELPSLSPIMVRKAPDVKASTFPKDLTSGRPGEPTILANPINGPKDVVQVVSTSTDLQVETPRRRNTSPHIN